MTSFEKEILSARSQAVALGPPPLECLFEGELGECLGGETARPDACHLDFSRLLRDSHPVEAAAHALVGFLVLVPARTADPGTQAPGHLAEQQ